jgi:hypothetical protein
MVRKMGVFGRCKLTGHQSSSNFVNSLRSIVYSCYMIYAREYEKN